jgi:hypothetical protein
MFCEKTHDETCDLFLVIGSMVLIATDKEGEKISYNRKQILETNNKIYENKSKDKMSARWMAKNRSNNMI